MTIRPDGAKIRRWRDERCWSQDDLAAKSGVSLRTVQRVENGDAASRDTLASIAAAFDVDSAALTIAPAGAGEEQGLRLDGLSLSFVIHLASYLLGLTVFAVISMTDGPGGYSMRVPAMWWTVGITAHGLVLATVWGIVRYGRTAAD